MTDSYLHGTNPTSALIAFPGADREPVGTGEIARILAAPDTSDYVRTWLAATLRRDPLLAYHEAATLAGMLELLNCEEARAWLLPAMKAALQQAPATGLADVLDIATALKPAAMALQELGMNLPEPANNRG
jgi:hypothetical protein